ncbi:MAG TPA: carboxypeptidase-like regulatory domain-containing protein [Cytophagales bacterium]
MADITGTVFDSRNVPMPGVTMILAGPGANSVIQLTGAGGRFEYPAMAPGDYKLIAMHSNVGYVADQSFTHDAAANATVNFTMNAAKPPQDNRYLILKYAQYFFLGLVGWFFFKQLVGDRMDSLNLANLNDMEVARGAITYLVAVTTVAMAALLLLAAIMTGGKDLDKRFALGREILTLLIGILGTIIGFYYGSSVDGRDGNNGQNGADSVQVSSVKLDPASPKAKGTFTVTAQVGGGTAPYTYSVTFKPPVTANAVTNKQSKDGKITETFTVPDTVTAGTNVSMTISGKDSKNVPFTTPDDEKHRFVTSQ